MQATTLFGGVQGLNILIGLVRTKLVAVLLGPTGVGLNSIYNETRELVHSTTNLGLDVSGVRNISIAYENDDPAELSRQIVVLRTWVLLLALLGTALTMLLAQPLSYLTFQDASHTWAYVLLSPAVGLSTVACGELTVLKGIRRLRDVAMVSVLQVITGTCVSIPIYYVWGLGGIIAGLIAVYLSSMLVIMCYSYRCHAPRFDFSRSSLGVGVPLLKVGTAFMLTNLIDNLIQLVIQSSLNGTSSIDTVGLYHSNTTITMTYLGVFIATLGNDYFPRLSGVFADVDGRRQLVRDHASFLMSIVSPALMAMLFALPLLVPMLLSEKFVDVIPLTQLALPAMLFRTVHLPFTYTPLAAGDSRTFFVLNTIQAADVLLVIPGFIYGGLVGIGVVLVVTNLIDLLCALFCAWYRYGVTMSCRTLVFFLVHSALLASGYFVAVMLQGTGYWCAAAAFVLASMAVSALQLRTESCS